MIEQFNFDIRLIFAILNGKVSAAINRKLSRNFRQNGLEITPEQIRVKASDTKGFFYALQSIRQLLPAAIESEQPVRNIIWSIPAVTIQDEPRFGFRGLLLDPLRCFIPKENVLRIIDCMAMLKINKLHFHLTDDNGWRIEIKKYPRLNDYSLNFL